MYVGKRVTGSFIFLHFFLFFFFLWKINNSGLLARNIHCTTKEEINLVNKYGGLLIGTIIVVDSLKSRYKVEFDCDVHTQFISDIDIMVHSSSFSHNKSGL